MQRARFKMFGLALLALGLASGCGTNGTGTGTKKGDGGSADGGDTGEATRGSNGKDGGGDKGGSNGDASATTGESTTGGTMDAGPDASATTGDGGCTPMYFGCDDKYPEVTDPMTLCGEIDDGCGNIIDCDPEDDNCEGFGIACNDPEKPNQCGCAAKTCDDVVVGGADCGGPSDGCGMTLDCGGCTGSQDTCDSTTYQCECVGIPQGTACNNRACGTAADGCGDTDDDYTCGTCSQYRKCTVGASASTCDCDAAKRATACGAQNCGTVAVDGCTFNCDPGNTGAACVTTCASGAACNACTCPGLEKCNNNICCTPLSQAAACGAQDCGSVSDGCGGSIACGANAGGCGAGESCADPKYNLDAPTRSSARVQKCLPSDQANLLGKYAVRTHVFRGLDPPSGSDATQRAEAVSLVTIERSGGSMRMTDIGCVATGVDSDNANPTLAPRYYNIPQVVVPLTMTTGAWTRGYQPTPTGYIAQQPPFCNDGTLVPASDGEFDTTPTNLVTANVKDTDIVKTWRAGNCTCVTGDQTVLPTETTASNWSTVTDCRVNDIDNDGKPGFTLIGSSVGIGLSTQVVTNAQVKWDGSVLASGYHRGAATEPAQIDRNFVGCQALLGCNLITQTVDWSCGSEYNRIQFVKLLGAEESKTCLDFYKNNSAPSALNDQDQTEINSIFSAIPGSTCTVTADCGVGLACKANTCWPMTTPGACAVSADCGDVAKWQCGFDKACWPKEAASNQACAKP